MWGISTIRAVVLVTGVLAVVGCMKHQSMSEPNRKELKDLSIQPERQKDGQPKLIPERIHGGII